MHQAVHSLRRPCSTQGVAWDEYVSHALHAGGRPTSHAMGVAHVQLIVKGKQQRDVWGCVWVCDYASAASMSCVRHSGSTCMLCLCATGSTRSTAAAVHTGRSDAGLHHDEIHARQRGVWGWVDKIAAETGAAAR